MRSFVQVFSEYNVDFVAIALLCWALLMILADAIFSSLRIEQYCWSARQAWDYSLMFAALCEVFFLANSRSTASSQGFYTEWVWLLIFPKLGWAVIHIGACKSISAASATSSKICTCGVAKLNTIASSTTTSATSDTPTISHILNRRIETVMYVFPSLRGTSSSSSRELLLQFRSRASTVLQPVCCVLTRSFPSFCVLGRNVFCILLVTILLLCRLWLKMTIFPAASANPLFLSVDDRDIPSQIAALSVFSSVANITVDDFSNLANGRLVQREVRLAQVDLMHVALTTFVPGGKIDSAKTLIEDAGLLHTLDQRSYLTSQFNIPFIFLNNLSSNHSQWNLSAVDAIGTNSSLVVDADRMAMVQLQGAVQLAGSFTIIVVILISAARQYNLLISGESIKPIYRMIKLIKKLAGTIFAMVRVDV